MKNDMKLSILMSLELKSMCEIMKTLHFKMIDLRRKSSRPLRVRSLRPIKEKKTEGATISR